MARTQASIVVPGRISDAEDLFYDLRRWPTWIDGLAHVVRTQGDWPHEGAEVIWQSRPGGRGRVSERVVSHIPREGQVSRVEDESLLATQRVAFTAEGAEHTRVTLSLEFETKDRSALGPVRAFFVKRSLSDSLNRTLWRFANEREGDLRL